jgi:hypothetical protein
MIDRRMTTCPACDGTGQLAPGTLVQPEARCCFCGGACRVTLEIEAAYRAMIEREQAVGVDAETTVRTT